MRENLGKTSSVESLPFNDFKAHYNVMTNSTKPVHFSVSSNVYYGYQPLTNIQAPNSAEPMHTEESYRCGVEMETTQLESHFVNRKRTRNSEETPFGSSKKKRQNESHMPHNLHSRCSPSKAGLDEELLRETHGCSYYHWVASNI